VITVVDVVNETGIQIFVFTLPSLVHNCRRIRGKALHNGGRNIVGVTNVGNQRCRGLPW